MSTCAVKFCGRTKKSSNYRTNGITFHLFPKNTEKRNLWIYATCRGKDWSPTNYSRICSIHFKEEEFHYMKKRRRLVENAIPTLNLPHKAAQTLQAVSAQAKETYDFSSHYVKNLDQYLKDPEESPGVPIPVQSSDPSLAETEEVKSFKTRVFKACKNKLLNVSHPPTINADAINRESNKKRKYNKFALRYRPKDYYNIIQLSEEEMLQKRELDKSVQRYLNYAYKCEKCIIGFDDQGLYDRHVKDKHEFAGQFVCPVCDTRVARASNFRQHVDNHYRYFQCKRCSYGHHRYEMLITHARHHEQKEVEMKYGNPKKKSKRKQKVDPEKVATKSPRIPILLGDLQL